GPGNNNFNSFDISRVYTNLYFFPTKDWQFRFTPDIYKTTGCNSNTCSDTIGRSSQTGTGTTLPAPAQTGFGTNLDGDLALRIKYAYLQYQSLWDKVPMLKGGTITFGALQNPFIPWEEDLYGYRFVNLGPWNYLGLSSSNIGLQMEGPLKLRGGETNYLDY